MIFTTEPMLNVGKPFSRLGRDGWRASTRMASPTLLELGVTNNGFEVFTESPQGLISRPIKRRPPAPAPINTAIARLRERLLEGEDKALADYELLEAVLFGAIPRSDTKPLAKR